MLGGFLHVYFVILLQSFIFIKNLSELEFQINDNINSKRYPLDSQTFLDLPENLIFTEPLDLEGNTNLQMLTNLCIGTPSQCFNVLVDSGSFYLWVSDTSNSDNSKNHFDYTKSTTFKKTSITTTLRYGTGSAEGTLSYEKCTIGNNVIDNLKFILVGEEQGNTGIDGILGLGYNYDDLGEADVNNYSILEQLYNKKIINKRLFTQKFTGSLVGKMYIGDIPTEIENDLAHFGKCPTIKTFANGALNPYWQCNLGGIFFGFDNVNQTQFFKNAPVLFDTGTNIIIAPTAYLLSLKDTYFKDLIDSKKCFIKQDSRFKEIVCLKSADVLSLPDVNFVFGEWIIKMRARELFYLMSDNLIHFNIISSTGGNGEWILGEPVLKKYHIVFNKEENYIGFYGTKDLFKRDIPFTPDGLPVYLILLIIFGSLILVALIAFIVYKYIKNRSNNVIYNPEMNFGHADRFLSR